MVMKSDMQELKGMKSDMEEFKTDMHHRFDKLEAKFEGVGGQFELATQSRWNECDFIADKVIKLEKEIYLLRSNQEKRLIVSDSV